MRVFESNKATELGRLKDTRNVVLKIRESFISSRISFYF